MGKHGGLWCNHAFVWKGGLGGGLLGNWLWWCVISFSSLTHITCYRNKNIMIIARLLGFALLNIIRYETEANGIYYKNIFPSHIFKLGSLPWLLNCLFNFVSTSKNQENNPPDYSLLQTFSKSMGFTQGHNGIAKSFWWWVVTLVVG